MENKIGNGNVVRNDTQDGRIIYRFQCNSGFFLHGSSVISCLQGQWNGSTPSCLPGKVIFNNDEWIPQVKLLSFETPPNLRVIYGIPIYNPQLGQYILGQSDMKNV